MHRLLSRCGCLALVLSSGCALCDNSLDTQYAAYGGSRQRADMVHGRVASVYDPAPEVIQPSGGEQSPQPALPPSSEPTTSPDIGPTESEVPFDPTPKTPSNDLPPEIDLPESPNGTIELPEEGLDNLPSIDDRDGSEGLPPDLPGDDRSAWRHPLEGLFDDEV